MSQEERFGYFLELGFWPKPPLLFGTSCYCKTRIEFFNLQDASFSVFLSASIHCLKFLLKICIIVELWRSKSLAETTQLSSSLQTLKLYAGYTGFSLPLCPLSLRNCYILFIYLWNWNLCDLYRLTKLQVYRCTTSMPTFEVDEFSICMEISNLFAYVWWIIIKTNLNSQFCYMKKFREGNFT